jgi:uncharacterized cysteine cluster protein YcgN (CxxCxxCC family)
MEKRSCGTCTKCCEGYLSGEALGHTFYPGKPCHFIAIGTGCTVYDNRPKEPCVSYKCLWLTNEDMPEWMKPSDINSIIDIRHIDVYQYLNLKEAGSSVQARVLSWFFKYALSKNLNAAWEVEGGLNWIGSIEFTAAMDAKFLSK